MIEQTRECLLPGGALESFQLIMLEFGSAEKVLSEPAGPFADTDAGTRMLNSTDSAESEDDPPPETLSIDIKINSTAVNTTINQGNSTVVNETT